MKLIVFLLAFFFFTAVSSKAQQYKLSVGGGFGILSSKNKQQTGGVVTSRGRSTVLILTPEIGYFLNEKTQLALAPFYKSDNSKNYQPSGDSYESHDAGVSLLCRYFFGKERLRPLVGGGISGSKGRYKFMGLNSQSDEKASFLGINTFFGLSYKVGKRFLGLASVGLMGYQYEVRKPVDGSAKYNNSTFNIAGSTSGYDMNMSFIYLL